MDTNMKDKKYKMDSYMEVLSMMPSVYWTFRKSGGTGDPNTFAAEVLVFIFTTVYLFLHNKNRTFLILSIMAFLYGIFYAGSKSAFLALAVILILLMFKYLIYDLKYVFNYKSVLCKLIFLKLMLSLKCWIELRSQEQQNRDSSHGEQVSI